MQVFPLDGVIMPPVGLGKMSTCTWADVSTHPLLPSIAILLYQVVTDGVAGKL